MQLIVNDDPSVANAPQGFNTAVNNAVAILDAVIVDPITVTIDIGWGEDDGAAVPSGTLSEAQPASGVWVTYDQLRADLKTNTPDTASFMQNLPASDPSDGGTYFLSTAEEKALGLINPTSSEVDGYVGVSSNYSYTFDQSAGIAVGTYDLTGILLHELTHALGRYAAPGFTTILDLMTYDTSTGQLDLTNGVNNKYVSLDGGQTDLVNLNTSSDPSDFAGNTIDPDNAFVSPGTIYQLTTLDTRLMNVLGFNIESPTDTTSPPNTVITSDGPTIVDANGNTWSIVNGQVAVNGAVDNTTARVIALGYADGMIWQENADLNWWSKTTPTDTWSIGTPPAGISDPSLPVSANNTLVTNENETIIDANGNTWSFRFDGQVWVNGNPLPGTRHGTALAYVNGDVWEQVDGLWCDRTSPTSSLNLADGQSNSPLTGSPVNPQPASPPSSANSTAAADNDPNRFTHNRMMTNSASGSWTGTGSLSDFFASPNHASFEAAPAQRSQQGSQQWSQMHDATSAWPASASGLTAAHQTILTPA